MSLGCKFKVNVGFGDNDERFNAFTTYILFCSFRTTQRDRLLYSAFTDTNYAFTDLERTLIKWEISPKWLHLMAFCHNHSKQQIYIMCLVLLKKNAVQKNYDTKSLNNQIDSLKIFAGAA